GLRDGWRDAYKARRQTRRVEHLIVYRRKLIAIEMKSPGGRCSEAHRAFRERLLQARAQWWVCRSANAAMWALGKSGVRLAMIIEEDGREERWKQPRLAAWEGRRS